MTVWTLLVALAAVADGLADGVAAGPGPVGTGRMAVVPASRRITAPLVARALAAGLPTAVDGAVRRCGRLIAFITLQVTRGLAEDRTPPEPEKGHAWGFAVMR